MSWEPVYRLVKRIPRGRVTTYGALARALKVPGGARVVGYAMAGCPSGRGIPWHRVVGAGGRLIIREPYASKQRRLLESEGIEVGARSLDMQRFGWLPKAAPKKRRQASAGKRKKA
ncbi:MAG TPA: MGMT family protein [Candidatus Acidoferrales bacterium]|jgi:methylated-DNA-protein-cysteine methyltransferase-like protein|nr:MGMT family protein [Candidatus Acidoferrales bacterium]